MPHSFIGRNDCLERILDALILYFGSVCHMGKASKAGPGSCEELDADVILIGGGIMSATLGSMLAVLQPDWRILLLEKATGLATESSGPRNNAGTGHSGYCELNYMPDPADGRKASTIARQFHLSRQWWAHLVGKGLLSPDTFVHATPHMDVVFGRRDIAYLRKRFETLTSDPLFAGMAYTEDPATISEWAPLMVEGRTHDEPMAAASSSYAGDRCSSGQAEWRCVFCNALAFPRFGGTPCYPSGPLSSAALHRTSSPATRRRSTAKRRSERHRCPCPISTGVSSTEPGT